MPQFQLDTFGTVKSTEPDPNRAGFKPNGVYVWESLSPFVQGYIEALFFTEEEQLCEESNGANSYGFSNLAPETLARIIADCGAFQAGEAWQQWLDHAADSDIYAELEKGGRDFWFTRNGHGVGFWDGDWAEPHAEQLTAASKATGETSAYLGDNGKVYLL